MRHPVAEVERRLSGQNLIDLPLPTERPLTAQGRLRPRSGECPFTLPLQTSINANR